jgi:septal ring factor EnvC (AmiA/AmiB activator)
MNRYLILEVAHSKHGRVKRIHISYRALRWAILGVVLAAAAVLGLFSRYVQMSWEVAQYQQLRADFEGLRTNYQHLQQVSRQSNEQIASLESLASEVSVAFGIAGRPGEGLHDLQSPDSLAPTVKESVREYNFLKAASFSSVYRRSAFQWQMHSEPSLWPVDGVLRSSFGGRCDPLSGEGTFHTGVDLSAATGTPVHVTADGVVISAGWSGSYGKLVVVDHGNGIETYYAHLSEFQVLPGQEVHRGQVIALSGGTGRVTGPHMHYEVRLHGTPVNPYRYLVKAPTAASTSSRSDLGL